MNLHERGKQLSTAITGTFGVIAVIAASALGLHTWADIEATKAASQNSATVVAPSSAGGDSGSANDGSGHEGSGDDGTSSSSANNAPANNAPAPLVVPGNGGPAQATTSGS